MKIIGDRVSINKGDEQTTIVISSKIPSWKESLLAAWIVSWLACLGFFIYELFQPHKDNEQIFIFVMTIFMSYYAFRIIKVYFWRRYGKEYIKITDDDMVYKRSFRNYGKAHRFFLENIKDISLITKGDASISKALENSFWVMGGEKIAFKNLEKNYRIGMQLNDNDAISLASWIEKEINRRLKLKS